MKTIKLFIAIVLIALSTLQTKGQIKIVTSGNVGIGGTPTDTTNKLEVLGNQLISGNGNKLFFGNSDRYLGFPTSTQDFSLISKNSNFMRIGSNGGIAFWGSSGADSNTTTYQMFLNTYGLGIGGGNQAWGSIKFAVWGDSYISGNWYIASDQRFKKNIKPIENALDKVLKLNGREYNFRKDEFKTMEFNDGKNIGFIAQELKQIFPELIMQDKGGYYSINYTALIPVLVEAIKEQQVQISEITNKLSENNQPSVGGIRNLDNLSTASLSQNAPNPFNEKTEINYFIPENSNQAIIFIYNMNGVQLKEFVLKEKGKGKIVINGAEFEAGMYLYALIIDNKEISTKRMILTK